MENRSVTYQKALGQLPTISERYTLERNAELWETSKVKIGERHGSKSPIHKNYFMPVNNTPVPSVSLNKSTVLKSKIDFSRIREKHLHDLDLQLDSQEMKYCDLENLKNLEPLFYSYSAYLEGIIQCIANSSHSYKTLLSRAKNGFISVFRKIFSKVTQANSEFYEKSSQTVMSINPQRFSIILSKLGDIVNEELAGTERLEKFIQKNFIVNKRKNKVNNAVAQTEYRIGDNGVILYQFRTYEEIEKELEMVKKVNQALVQEKMIMEQKYEVMDDTERLVYRNKVLETMVIKLRHSGLYKEEDFNMLIEKEIEKEDLSLG